MSKHNKIYTFFSVGFFINLSWFLYFIYFNMFYKAEIIFIDNSLSTINKIVTLLSYTWTSSFKFLITYTILTMISFIFYGIWYKKEIYRNYLIVFLLVTAVFNLLLVFNIYGFIFICLFGLSMLLSYVILTIYELRNKTFLIYKPEDVIETKGPFTEEPNLFEMKEDFINNWNLNEKYEVEVEAYVENEEYYVDYYIKRIKSGNEMNEVK